MQRYQSISRWVVALICSLCLVLGSTVANAQTERTAFHKYVPYLHESYALYLGDGTSYYRKDYLLEFKPDANGVFQVASYNQANEAVAYIYQIREDGLYELARFVPYTTVADLRYSVEATDSEESLVLPNKLEANVSYKSGYDRSIQRTIVARDVECQIDDIVYYDVVKVKQVQDNAVTYHYYAPHYGLVLVTSADGSPIELLSTDY
ncbi:hypothetical protein NHG31_04240 [Aerococcaceae bacterium NML171108]|nr:hypothetical protein [Aerococcaceae bacterium NML171108]